MTSEHLKRAGAAIIILAAIAVGLWLLLPHGDGGGRGGTVKVVPVAPVEEPAPDVLSEKLSRHTKEVTQGLANLRRGKGALTDGTRWTYEQGVQATGADVATVDGGTVSAIDGEDESEQAAPARLALRFDHRPSREDAQKAVRDLLSDHQAKITDADGVWVLESDQLVAAAVTADGRTVTLDGVFLKSECDRAQKLRPSMQLAAACRITPEFPEYDGPTKKFPRPKLTEEQRNERVPAPEGATPPERGLVQNGKPYRPDRDR